MKLSLSPFVNLQIKTVDLMWPINDRGKLASNKVMQLCDHNIKDKMTKEVVF